jgi:hypothetical protein
VACPQGSWPAAVFYLLGHPTPYTYAIIVSAFQRFAPGICYERSSIEANLIDSTNKPNKSTESNSTEFDSTDLHLKPTQLNPTQLNQIHLFLVK